MSQPRFQIRRLMALMIPIGVTLAALIRPNRGSAAVVSILMVTSLLTAILGVVLRRGPARGFWLGFALFGWSLLLFIAFGENRTDWRVEINWFLTIAAVGDALDAVRSLNQGSVLDHFRSWGQQDRASELQVILSTMALAFAYLGGRIGRHLARDEPAGAPPLDAAAARRDRIAATR